MSELNKNGYIKDFANRTFVNLDIIKRESGNHYEITQLVNSLLGLIVLPHEAYYDEAYTLKNARFCSSELKKIDDIVEECINEKKYYCNYDNKEQTAVEIIKHMRNSVAHSGDGRLVFCTTPRKEKNVISSIIFYDTDGNHEFCMELSENQLSKFVKATIAIYEKVETNAGIKDWETEAKTKRTLFSSTQRNYCTNADYITYGKSTP